jgi:hypothetical protein
MMLLDTQPLRSLIESTVSAHIGRRWTIQTVRDMHDFACHPSAILSDETFSVFAKYSDAADGSKQFETELAGLKTLQALAGVLISNRWASYPPRTAASLLWRASWRWSAGRSSGAR